MIYSEHKPLKALSDYIQLIWLAESESESDTYAREKIMPDGIIEIVFHFGEPFFTYNNNGIKLKQPKAFAISQLRKFIEIESDGSIGLVSIRFYPWGAHHFFNLPIGKFLDNTIDLKHLWGNDHQIILKQLQSVTNDEKIKIIQTFLHKCLLANKKNTDGIDDLIKFIRKTRGQYSIELLCKKSGLTYKQLERKFLSTIGTTPKVFSRTTRFLHLCHNLKDYENKTLSQLTYDLGYYDQAHFIKDFKAFSGFTPKEYYEQKNVSFADF